MPYLRSPGAAIILGAMEELKCCLFCGRYIDTTFRYCPYCGYEFSAREDLSEMAEELSGEGPSTFPPAGDEVEPQRFVPPAVQERPEQLTCIARIKNMEKLLSDIERELDLMLSSAKRPVTSSLKGP